MATRRMAELREERAKRIATPTRPPQRNAIAESAMVQRAANRRLRAMSQRVNSIIYRAFPDAPWERRPAANRTAFSQRDTETQRKTNEEFLCVSVSLCDIALSFAAPRRSHKVLIHRRANN